MNRYNYIQTVIDSLSDKDKKRLSRVERQQTHEFVYFRVSVFNAGTVVSFRQTNKYIEKNVSDGYSFYLYESELNLFTF